MSCHFVKAGVRITTSLGLGNRRESFGEKGSPTGTTGPWCPYRCVASAATPKGERDSKKLLMQLDVEREGSEKMMVLGQKGGAWDKCRSGWLDLAGAHGFDPIRATILCTEKSSNLQTSHQEKHGSD